MYKKSVILMAILIFGCEGLAFASAAPFRIWRCLVYDGMVLNNRSYNVKEDTGVFVTNPNRVPVNAWIRIFNKYGKEVWSGFLQNSYGQIKQIPSMGFGWMPLGWALMKADYGTYNGREKMTYQISMSKPILSTSTEPILPCVVEVKQVIYEKYVNPLSMIGRPSVWSSEFLEVSETNPDQWTRCPVPLRSDDPIDKVEPD